MKQVCAANGCDQPVRAVGLCARHYKQHQVASRPLGWCKGASHKTRRPLNTRGYCVGCATVRNHNKRLRRAVRELLGPARGAAAGIAALRKHLLKDRSAQRVIDALAELEPPVRRYLADVRQGRAMTWESLQSLRIYPGGQWLISACRRAGIVTPPRVDIPRVEQQLHRMERIDRRAERVVTRYWNEYIGERLNVRKHYKRCDPTLESDRAALWIAFDFLRFAAKRGKSADQIEQGDVTAWQIACESSRRSTRTRKGRELRFARSHMPRLKPFLKWLFDARIIRRRFELPKGKISAGTSLTPETLQALERRARYDETLPLVVRVALLLMIMCARFPFEIVALSIRAIRKEQHAQIVWVQFAKGSAQPLEGDDAALLLRLVRQRKSAKGEWLFRSKPRPEAHLTTQGISGLIREAGITVNLNHLRNAAFRDCLKDFTPGEAAEIRGMRPSIAEHWEKRGYTLNNARREYVNDLSRHARRRRRHEGTAP